MCIYNLKNKYRTNSINSNLDSKQEYKMKENFNSEMCNNRFLNLELISSIEILMTNKNTKWNLLKFKDVQ